MAITSDKLVVTGTFTGAIRRSYEVRIEPRNNESDGTPDGTIGYSLFKWRITNIDRILFLKFTQSDQTVLVREYDASTNTFSDSISGLPIYVGDEIQEVSGGGDFDAANKATISSINAGTEGVNVTSFEIDAVPDAVSGTADIKCKYYATYKTHSSESVPRLCNQHESSGSKVSHTALHGLQFYFNGSMNSAAFPNQGSGSSLHKSYFFYQFTAYPAKEFNADKMVRMVRNGQHSILSWNSIGKQLYYTGDLYQDATSVGDVSGKVSPISYNRQVPNKPCFTTRGDDIYIGAGKERYPIYAGYPNFKQFGKKMGDELVVEDGNIVVNSSVLPQFEQFVIPKPNGSTTFAPIPVADWAVNASTTLIVGYEKEGSFLIKATKSGGLESNFYCGGKISAIRLDPVETNKLWVLVNQTTHYKIMKIAINASGTAMAVDSNRIYSITRTVTSTGNLIPAASSTISALTDILVLDDKIYVQASANNPDNTPIRESLFNGIDIDRKAYIWRSDSINSAPGSIPNTGSTALGFTDITPSFSPSVNDTTENDNYEPYWYQFTRESIEEDEGGSETIISSGFLGEDELGDDIYQIKYGLPKRGLCIWDADTDNEAVGLMIPYTENSASNSSGSNFIEILESNTEQTTVSDRTTKITTSTERIGPLIYHGAKSYLLGSHIQIFNDAESAFSARLGSGSGTTTEYLGIKRLHCSPSTIDHSQKFGIQSGDPNFTGIDFYGDGMQFTGFSSITTCISGVLNILPKTVTIGYDKSIISWDLWQGDGSILNPLHAQDDGNTTDTDLDNASSTTGSGNFYSNSKTAKAWLNQGPETPKFRIYSPSNIADSEDTESEMSAPIRLAAQTVSFDQATNPDATNYTVVNFPDSDFGLFYSVDIETGTSGSDWSKIGIDSTIEISVASAGGSDYNLTNLKVDATFDDPEEGADSSTAYEDSNFYNNFYRVSIMYDGYQESCLSNTRYVATTNPDKLGHKLTVKLRTDMISKRLSHVNIYRSRGTTDNNPETEWLLIKSIALEGDGWTSPSGAGDTNILQYTFKDTVGANFGSYEALTGISPAMNINYVSYSISEECAGYLFVTDAENPEITSVNNYIFRSKPGKFNIFNWANEYVALPEKVNALKSYNNLLYAFSSSSVYTINPNNLSIIDNMEGQGVLSDESVIATDYGLFFADKYGAYVHNGKSSTKISYLIQESDNSSLSSLDWNSIDWESNPAKLGFDSQRKAVLFFFISSGSSYAWVYSVQTKRWDLWKFDNKITSITSGKYGEILASDGKLKRIATGSTRKAWEYQSKKVTAGFDTYEKQFKEIHAEGTSGLSLKYKTGLASGSWNALSSNRLSSSHSKSKWLQIQVIDSAGTRQLESLGIHLRPLKAKSTRI